MFSADEKFQTMSVGENYTLAYQGQQIKSATFVSYAKNNENLYVIFEVGMKPFPDADVKPLNYPLVIVPAQIALDHANLSNAKKILVRIEDKDFIAGLPNIDVPQKSEIGEITGIELNAIVAYNVEKGVESAFDYEVSVSTLTGVKANGTPITYGEYAPF